MEVSTENAADPPMAKTKEGKAEIFSPPNVFYNPVQEFNRDLTIAVLSLVSKDKNADTKSDVINNSETENNTMCPSACEKKEIKLEAGKKHENGISILEGLAASGLRSVRFALEIPGVKKIVANDFSNVAVEYIKKNIEHNGVEKIVQPSLSDASMVMYRHKHIKNRFDVVDVDPYGSPTPFLDAAVQSVKDGGLLCVTCTDVAVLCGNASEACHAKYGAMSLRTKFCHEMALRIVLQCVESHANRYSRYIVPMLSVSVDFYVRLYIKVFSGQSKVKESVTKLSMLYVCSSCGAYHLQPLATKVPTRGDNRKFVPGVGPPVSERCSHCGGRHNLGGPIWSAPIHDVDFVSRVVENVEENLMGLGTSQRIIGMLTLIKEELVDVPLYYSTDELCRIVHCCSPTQVQMRSALLNAGYKVSYSHAAKNSMKTDAPIEFIWDIIRAWVKTNPVSEKRLNSSPAAAAILSKQSLVEINFSLHPLAIPPSQKNGLIRWQLNPLPDWGPKVRAGVGNSLEERRQKGIERAEDRKSKRKANVDYKQFPCKRFKAGTCKLGEECQYSHLNNGSTNEQST